MRLGTAALMLAALILTSIVTYQWMNSDSTPVLASNPSDTQELIKNLTAKLDQAKRKNLIELSQDLEQPLDRELKNLTSDAKSALTFLVQNFLPADSNYNPQKP